MYKMLVLDMDGTLLNEEQSITPKTLGAIKKIRDKGIHVVLASGRHYLGMIPYLKELGLYGSGEYSITCSGALVIENGVDTILYEEHIPHDDIKLIHSTCEALDIDLCGYSKDSLIIHHENLFSRYDQVANQTDLVKVDFNNLDKDMQVYKLNIINESNEIANEIIDYFPTISVEDYSIRHKKDFNPNLLDELWRFPKEILDKYNVVRPLPFSVEIFDIHSNKAVGVEIIAEKLGIKMSEVVAVGDSGNDVHMIEEAGLGIAMENARQEAKDVADAFTYSNDNDGVAHVIEKYFLL